MITKQSRGYRNNNPGNVRNSHIEFIGEVKPSQDPEFKQFKSMAHGYRVMFVILHRYFDQYNLRTIRSIIYRWAPPSENDSDNYVQYVSKRTGFDPDKTLPMTERHLVPIVTAMSYMENGVEPNMDDVQEGWELAFNKVG